MKKTIFTLTLAFATMTLCIAQQIEMKKVFGGYKFSQNNENLTMSNLVKTMESNQQAFELIKKAKSKNSLASIIGFAGGGLIGWPIGTAVAGGEANWTLAGIGAGLLAVGIPISLSAINKAKEAVEIYNSSLNTTSYNKFQPEFKIIANGEGIGLTMNF
jgi:hypothetical protein